MVESFESEGFLFEMPVYVIWGGKPGGLLKADGLHGEKHIVIFLDEPAAKDFQTKLPSFYRGQCTIKIIPDVFSLIGLLVVMEKQDYTHVNINGSNKQSHNRAIARIVADACRFYDLPESEQ